MEALGIAELTEGLALKVLLPTNAVESSYDESCRSRRGGAVDQPWVSDSVLHLALSGEVLRTTQWKEEFWARE